MNRTDGCPECLTRGNRPSQVETSRGGFTAIYRCGKCGNTWRTSWAAQTA